MSFPFTTAQTSGPGAASLLQETASKQAVRMTRASSALRRGRITGPRIRGLSREAPRGQRRASSSLLDAARADAGSADADVFPGAIADGLHATKVGIPAAACDIVRVADRISKRRLLTTHFTDERHF